MYFTTPCDEKVFVYLFITLTDGIRLIKTQPKTTRTMLFFKERGVLIIFHSLFLFKVVTIGFTAKFCKFFCNDCYLHPPIQQQRETFYYFDFYVFLENINKIVLKLYHIVDKFVT